MGESIRKAGVFPWLGAYEFADCACGKPAEDDDPRCADCITEAERDAEEAAGERSWALLGCAA